MEGVKVVIGSPGPTRCWPNERALFCHPKSRLNPIRLIQHDGWWGMSFNSLWAEALTLNEREGFTHFAMLHSDVVPDDEPDWVDLLFEELERHAADLVSAVVPIKDARGVTSTGIGDARNNFCVWKRFTVREVLKLPETFDAALAGYPGWPLMHNTGCWMADLRKPLWRKRAPDGSLAACFNFPLRIMGGEDGVKFRVEQESEDWYFSRVIHDLGARTFLTRRVRLYHGSPAFRNDKAWGRYENGDEDTAAKWRAAKS